MAESAEASSEKSRALVRGVSGCSTVEVDEGIEENELTRSGEYVLSSVLSSDE